MGMKRFSAPPALYPSPTTPPPVVTYPSPPSPTPPSIPATTTTVTTPISGWGHHHQHHHHHHNHHHHDPSSKRVKTEQTFESLFDKETHSDVTISVNNDECVFHAHRVILEMKSDVMAAMLAKLKEKAGVGEGERGTGKEGGRPVLHVLEDAECCHVFSRFLYFLYSGAVWLHQDYVLPLYRLAHKYRVKPLRTHCETYVLQVLAKSCSSSSPTSSSSSSSNNRSHNHNNNNNNNNSSSNMNHNHSPPGTLLSSPNANSPPYCGSGFPLDVVCDLYEDSVYEGDIQQTAFRLLCCQFRQLVRSPRWLRCGVNTVCSLLASDCCSVEENLVLVAATDFMKRNTLADKQHIQDILSLIRYPRLNRRVLYHLQKNASFTNFPHIQQLMIGALQYHSFKDLPEAQGDFKGAQFRPRMSHNLSPNRRASMHVATTVTDAYLQPEQTVFSESAYSLDPGVPVTLTQSRQSQV